MRLALCVNPTAVTVAVAAVGKTRHVLELPGEVGVVELDVPDESHAAATTEAISSSVRVCINAIVALVQCPPQRTRRTQRV